MIGAGIGVTPFASLLLYLRDVLRGLPPLDEVQRKDSGRIRLKRLRFIWVCKTLNQLQWFLDLITDLDQDKSTHSWLHISLFLTGTAAPAHLPVASQPAGATPHTVDSSSFRTLHVPSNAGTKSALRIYYARPALDRLLRDYAGRHSAGVRAGVYSSARVGVYFCGPKSMGCALEQACRLVNQQAQPSNHAGTQCTQLVLEQEIF